MRTYIAQRLLLTLPTLLGITVIVFVAVHLLPGDLVDQLSGDYGGQSAAAKAQLRESYSLNKGIATQYFDWMGKLFRGDLGSSLLSKRPVWKDLQQRLPVTVELGLIALVASQLIAVPIGIISALRQKTLVDFLARSLAIGLLAVPSFWLGLLVLTYGFVWFGWTPPLRYTYFWNNPLDNLQITGIPALILGAGLSGSVMRLTRSTMLEVLRQDYIRTAWAKGLRERQVVLRHALRNGLIPVLTVVGLQIPVLLGGTVVLERIFSLPGMGNFLLDSVQRRDYPVVQAVVLLIALAVVLTNFLIDLSYPKIDPRINYG